MCGTGEHKPHYVNYDRGEGELMITIVDILDVVLNKIIGLDNIPDEKKEKYLEIALKAIAEGAVNGGKDAL